MRTVTISERKLNTLRYWAYVGAASMVGQQYKKNFPERIVPHKRVENALKQLSGLKPT